MKGENVTLNVRHPSAGKETTLRESLISILRNNRAR